MFKVCTYCTTNIRLYKFVSNLCFFDYVHAIFFCILIRVALYRRDIAPAKCPLCVRLAQERPTSLVQLSWLRCSRRGERVDECLSACQRPDYIFHHAVSAVISLSSSRAAKREPPKVKPCVRKILSCIPHLFRLEFII